MFCGSLRQVYIMGFGLQMAGLGSNTKIFTALYNCQCWSRHGQVLCLASSFCSKNLPVWNHSDSKVMPQYFWSMIFSGNRWRAEFAHGVSQLSLLHGVKNRAYCHACLSAWWIWSAFVDFNTLGPYHFSLEFQHRSRVFSHDLLSCFASRLIWMLSCDTLAQSWRSQRSYA